MASAIAVWQLRPGLNPWFEGWNVGSHSGSSTCRTASWTTLSTTSGIPSPRCPPPALGMNTRRIPPGRYLPASRSACNPGSTTSHCASSSSIVCPSGPGAPLFDATFNNASVNRSATSSIVADAAVPVLSIAFGAPARISPSRSRDLLRVAPLGFSAVAIGRQSCTAVSSTGTAFPCPPGLDPARSTGITPPSGTTRSSDFCWAISRRPLVLRPTSQTRLEPSRSPWGETLRFRRDRAATTPPGVDRNRASPLRDSSPPEERLTALHFRSPPRHTYGLFQTRPHGSPRSASPSRTGDRPVNSGPRPCLFSVGFPLSGLQDRTSTSDLNIRTQHTRPPRYARRPSRRQPRHALRRAIRQHPDQQPPTRSGASSGRRGGATASRRSQPDRQSGRGGHRLP